MRLRFPPMQAAHIQLHLRRPPWFQSAPRHTHTHNRPTLQQRSTRNLHAGRVMVKTQHAHISSRGYGNRVRRSGGALLSPFLPALVVAGILTQRLLLLALSRRIVGGSKRADNPRPCMRARVAWCALPLEPHNTQRCNHSACSRWHAETRTHGCTSNVFRTIPVPQQVYPRLLAFQFDVRCADDSRRKLHPTEPDCGRQGVLIVGFAQLHRYMAACLAPTRHRKPFNEARQWQGSSSMECNLQ